MWCEILAVKLIKVTTCYLSDLRDYPLVKSFWVKTDHLDKDEEEALCQHRTKCQYTI